MDILIIDDSFTTRSFVRTAFAENGDKVFEAENGEIGFNKLISNKPDLIILDLLMPVMDGFEFLQKCKKENIKIPIIVLSADIQAEVKKDCLALGAKGFLNKPFESNVMLDLVASLNINSQ